MTPTLRERIDLANRVRSERAVIRRQLRVAHLSILDVLAIQPECLRSVPISTVLAWAPRMGPSRINRALRQLQIGELREFGSLTPRERTLLAIHLRRREQWVLGVAA